MRKQHGFAEVNGTRLYYEVAGSGHPLVLIHGITLDTRMWDDQFDAFTRHYQVVRYDVRGFGKSALPTGESYAHADDLRALMEHLGIMRAHILGLSMGGRIAIDFALAYPEATDTLIPVDASVSGYARAAALSYSSTAKEAGVQAARELWLKDPLFKPALEKPDVASRLAQIVSDYSGWHWFNDDPVRVTDPPAIQQLDKVCAPTLIIVGERDIPRVHTVADILQKHIPNARKVVLPGVGHMSNMEDPDRFNEIVLSFLANL
jgi:pimeloyl-ACP methyl ester carboxylesterase